MTFPEQRFNAYEQALITVMGCQLPRLTQGWSCQLLIQPTFYLPSCLTLLADTEVFLQYVILGDRPDDLVDLYFSRNSPHTPPILTPRPRLEALVTLTASQYATLQTQLASFNPWVLENLNLIGRDGMVIRCEWQDGTVSRTHTFSTLCSNLQHPEKQFYLFRILIELAQQSFTDEPFQSYLRELLP